MIHSIVRVLLALGVGAVVFAAADLASAQQGMLGTGTANCGLVKSRTQGCLFQNTTNPGTPFSNAVKPMKTGQACAFNILQIVALGDVRASTAARNAGITKVASVESEAFEVLPGFGVYKIYGRYCTVVKGE